MHKIYLTIDDSPSPLTDKLLDFLADVQVQALFFCRGDYTENNPQPVMRAIRDGHVIGNHGYHHVRASHLGLAGSLDNIRQGDNLFAQLHADVGVPWRQKHYRFAYMDRGAGPWFLDPATLTPETLPFWTRQLAYVSGGNAENVPTPAGEKLVKDLQTELANLGYTAFLPNDVTFAALQSDARDSGFSYASADWQITKRHMGKWGAHNVADLWARMDADPDFNRTDTAHIFLSHDQDETTDTTITMVQYLLDKGSIFGHIGA